MTSRRAALCLLFAAIAVALASGDVPAFCPMCKTAVEGATGAQEVAGSLSLAALVLLAPPVVAFAALFGLFYRLRNASGRQAALDDEADDRAARHVLTQ